VDELLPREGRIRWILDKSARLIDGGAEPVSGLVYPTGTFFPDHYDRTPAAVDRLLRRVLKLAGLSDLAVTSNVIAADGSQSGGCASGACGTGAGPVQLQRVAPSGDGYQVNVAQNELSNPVVLTTGLVRAVSHIFMKEADLYPLLEQGDGGGVSRADLREGGVDLCGTLLGFGLLLCNGAYIYKKG
jgi:hypothetical protein